MLDDTVKYAGLARFALLHHFGSESGIDFFEMIKEFPVLHRGWECDDTAFVVRVASAYYIVGTNHGRYEILSPEFLNSKCQEYAETINDTLKALEYSK